MIFVWGRVRCIQEEVEEQEGGVPTSLVWKWVLVSSRWIIVPACKTKG